MKKLTVLISFCFLGAAPITLADDEKSNVKRLPDLKVEDPVAEKALENADNYDLDPELRAILEEAEAAEQDS